MKILSSIVFLCWHLQVGSTSLTLLVPQSNDVMWKHNTGFNAHWVIAKQITWKRKYKAIKCQCVCVCVCVCGDILGSFYLYIQGDQFSHYYIIGLGETLIYSRLRQIGLISLKWGFLFEAMPTDFKQRILFGCSSTTMVYYSLTRDVGVSINMTYKIECCGWILIQPCNEVDNAMC